jgi:hypothetical protein
MQNLTESYDTTLSYSQHLEAYSIYINTENILEHIITETSMIEGDTPIIEYENILLERTNQIESIYKTHEIIGTLTVEETQSYFTKELDYSDVEVLYQERILEDDIIPETMSQTLEQEYIDDSSIIADMTPLAYVQKSSGNILVTNLAGWSKVSQDNMLLYAWYTLETFVGSELTIIFSDESILRIEENSRITLTESSSHNEWVQIEYGNLWARVIKPLFSNDSFTIESQSVSLAVRWTSVYIQKEENSDFTAYVIDSYVADWTQSLELTNSLTWEDITLNSGEVYQNTDESTPGGKNTFNKASLMQEESQISWYLREDIKYLSLMLDDRKRGFYNNPIWGKQDSKNFIDKISGELETSLPESSEIAHFFENAETPSTEITKDTIYMRLMQDEIITELKDSSNSDKEQKISTITSLDIDELKEDIWNLREIENRLNLDIYEEFIDSPTLTPDEVSNIFIGYGLEEEQAKITKLNNAKKYFLKNLNNGSPYISDDIDLPNKYKEISISWKSSNKTYLKNDWTVLKYHKDTDITILLSATFSLDDKELIHWFPIILKKKNPTDLEQLIESYNLLKDYISDICVFTDYILLPDFNDSWVIIPEIIWEQDEYVNSDGTLNRPTATEWDKHYHIAKATIKFWEAILENKEFVLKRIKAQPAESTPTPILPPTPEEIVVSLSEWFWSEYISSQREAASIAKWSNEIITSSLEFPNTMSGASIQYQTDSSYFTIVNNIWNVAPHCFRDKDVSVSALFTLSWATQDVEQDLKVPKIYENWRIIEGECYSPEEAIEYLSWVFWSRYISEQRSLDNIADWNNSITADYLDFPLTVNGIDISYQSDSSYFTISGKTGTPSPYCNIDKDISITATFTLDWFTQTITEDFIVPKEIKGWVMVGEECVNPTDVADNQLDEAVLRFEDYFMGTSVRNVEDDIQHPDLPNWVSVTWHNNPHVSTSGDVIRPSFDDPDRPITVKAKFTHADATSPKYLNNIDLLILRETCSGTVIDDECYELIASAEYNTAWDYKLNKTNGWSISWNVSSWVSNNGMYLDSTLRWITQINKRKSLVEVWGERWIYLDNTGSDDSLSYNLSSLELWDDWAIEISVRGEDLRKRSADDYDTYYIFWSPWEFSVYNYRWLSRVYDWIRAEINTLNINSWYQSIILTPNRFQIWSLINNHNKDLDISNTIKLWVARSDTKQWNWIIDYIKIFKKKWES